MLSRQGNYCSADNQTQWCQGRLYLAAAPVAASVSSASGTGCGGGTRRRSRTGDPIIPELLVSEERPCRVSRLRPLQSLSHLVPCPSQHVKSVTPVHRTAFKSDRTTAGSPLFTSMFCECSVASLSVASELLRRATSPRATRQHDNTTRYGTGLSARLVTVLSWKQTGDSDSAAPTCRAPKQTIPAATSYRFSYILVSTFGERLFIRSCREYPKTYLTACFFVGRGCTTAVRITCGVLQIYFYCEVPLLGPNKFS